MNQQTSTQERESATKANSQEAVGALQRKCDCGNHSAAGSCKACAKERPGLLQRQSAGLLGAKEAPAIVHEVLNSAGQPLDVEARAFFEPRFGHDFSNVRVHSDTKATESAQAVDALAYTVGRHIVFAPGQYNPASEEGSRLIAHELTHVTQQSQGKGATDNTRQAPAQLSFNLSEDPSESEAQRIADTVVRGDSIPGENHTQSESSSPVTHSLQRQPASPGQTGALKVVNPGDHYWTVVRDNVPQKMVRRAHALRPNTDPSDYDGWETTEHSAILSIKEPEFGVDVRLNAIFDYNGAPRDGSGRYVAFAGLAPEIERIDSGTSLNVIVVNTKTRWDTDRKIAELLLEIEVEIKGAKGGKTSRRQLLFDAVGTSGSGTPVGTGKLAGAESTSESEVASVAPNPQPIADSTPAGTLQRAAIHPSESGAHASEVPPIVNEVVRSPGQPLDSGTRHLMEPRFGHDFSGVRVHSDAKAAESARAVNALAYTVGRNIVFGTSRYAPETKGGQWLLAHELSHVVQQSGAHGVGGREVIQQRQQEESEDQANRVAASVVEEGEHSSSPSLEAGPYSLQPFTAYEFFTNIPIIGLVFRGILEGDFSEQDLARYLQSLERRNAIEGNIDSDNKARAVVRMWKTGSKAIQLNPKRKRLLVKEMKDGDLSKDDALGILAILEVSEDQDLREIFSAQGVKVSSLLDNFGKNERLRLEQFLNRRFKGGVEATKKGVIEPMSAPAVLGQLNDETFRKRWEQGLATSLARLQVLVDAGGCKFVRPDKRRIDEENWRPFQSIEERIVKKAAFTPIKASPFDAVGLLFDNLDKWTCGCKLFPEIALLGAWREALKDRPVVFNNKFTPLVLRDEGTSGLDREVIETEEEAPWRDAPVGTKVAWKNTSYAARDPWDFEHAIKSRKGNPGEPDQYAAHGIGFDQTEDQVKRKLAEHSSDFPWIYRITASILKDLQADGVAHPIIQSLRTIENQDVKTKQAFLDTPPLENLRKQVAQDPPRFEALINNILGRARLAPIPAEAEKYLKDNIKRFKIEIPK